MRDPLTVPRYGAPLLHAPDSLPAAGGESPDLAADDVAALLRIMADISPLRNDVRAWRLILLEKMCELLGAMVGGAFILKHPGETPVVVSLFEWGFKVDAARQIFLKEFNGAPFRDPFSRRALEHFAHGTVAGLTTLRRELVDDAPWYGDGHVKQYRLAAGTDDCILSLQRGNNRVMAYALCFFRPAAPTGAAGNTGATQAGSRFESRHRDLLQAMHGGLQGVYQGEETTHRLNRASELPPRLRQTLECLLAGDTERQVALKMSLSVHTVHDYVKALYVHFGVSSRGELLSKWIQTSGQLPHTRSERE